jgi:hypothetical protein
MLVVRLLLSLFTLFPRMNFGFWGQKSLESACALLFLDRQTLLIFAAVFAALFSVHVSLPKLVYLTIFHCLDGIWRIIFILDGCNFSQPQR